MSLCGYRPICHLLYSGLPLRSRGPRGALNALHKLMSLVVNLVPVRYNSLCQNSAGGHDSSSHLNLLSQQAGGQYLCSLVDLY